MPGVPYLVIRRIVFFEVVHEDEIGHGKAPDVAFAHRPVVIDLIDSPVVRPAAPLDAFRWSVARAALLASIYAGRVGRIGAFHGIFIHAKVHIMLGRLLSRRPTERQCTIYVRRRSVARARVPRQGRIASHGLFDLVLSQCFIVDSHIVYHAEKFIVVPFMGHADQEGGRVRRTRHYSSGSSGAGILTIDVILVVTINDHRANVGPIIEWHKAGAVRANISTACSYAKMKRAVYVRVKTVGPRIIGLGENRLPVSAGGVISSSVYPCHHGNFRVHCQACIMRHLHVVADAVEFQGIVVMADYPLRVAPKCAVIAVPGTVKDGSSGTFVELPPADKVRVGNGYIGQGFEAPNIALMRGSTVKRVNPPVVSLVGFKDAGLIGCSRYGWPASGAFHRIEIIAEIHGVKYRAEAFRPT